KIERLVCWDGERVDLPAAPFRHRHVRLQKMRPRQIERQSFVRRSNRFVAPMIPGRFLANLPAKDRQCITMIAITAHNSARGVASTEENRNNQHRSDQSTIASPIMSTLQGRNL